MSDLSFDFSGFTLRLSGLPVAFGARLEADWGAFEVDVLAAPSLAIVAECAAAQSHDPAIPFSPKRMRGELRGEAARFVLPEGQVSVEADGAGRLRLAGEQDGRLYFAMMNLLRASIAWTLPRQGMLMLHAAGLCIDGRAFLLVGSEGCGKSTWVRCGIEGGARPISDDIVLVDTRPECPLAMGSPFRSTQRGDYGRGGWEIAALLLPGWGSEVTLQHASSLQAQAALVSNLPFVAEALSRPAIASAVDRLSAHRWRRLVFAPSPTFVPLLRDWESHGD